MKDENQSQQASTPTKRDDETQTAFIIRVMRHDVLIEVQKRLLAIKSTYAEDCHEGMVTGLNRAREEIENMIKE